MLFIQKGRGGKEKGREGGKEVGEKKGEMVKKRTHYEYVSSSPPHCLPLFHNLREKKEVYLLFI